MRLKDWKWRNEFWNLTTLSWGRMSLSFYCNAFFQRWPPAGQEMRLYSCSHQITCFRTTAKLYNVGRMKTARILQRSKAVALEHTIYLCLSEITSRYYFFFWGKQQETYQLLTGVKLKKKFLEIRFVAYVWRDLLQWHNSKPPCLMFCDIYSTWLIAGLKYEAMHTREN